MKFDNGKFIKEREKHLKYLDLFTNLDLFTIWITLLMRRNLRIKGITEKKFCLV